VCGLRAERALEALVRLIRLGLDQVLVGFIFLPIQFTPIADDIITQLVAVFADALFEDLAIEKTGIPCGHTTLTIAPALKFSATP
jgi:hypothetical protein